MARFGKCKGKYPEPTVPEGRDPEAAAAYAIAKALWDHAEEYSQFRGPIAVGPKAWIACRWDIDIAPPTKHDEKIPIGYHLLTGDLNGDFVRQTAEDIQRGIAILTKFLTDQGVPNEDGGRAVPHDRDG